MEVSASAAEFRERCELARRGGALVGFVPTMGYLHEGHLSLLGRSTRETGFTALSIFVNPLQFGPGEDLSKYPRDPDRDLALAEELGVELAFLPPQPELYPDGSPAVTVDPGPIGERLEGVSRPGHFPGVLTVVAKLFNLAGACRAYFGEKDAQQLFLVRRMVADLDFPVEVSACPTVREFDGLALSSRNAYLNDDERRAAGCLFRALERAAKLRAEGEGRAAVLKAEMARLIGAEALARIDYVAIVDDRSFEDVEELTGPCRALVAGTVGPARLIDNLRLPVPGGDPMAPTNAPVEH